MQSNRPERLLELIRFTQFAHVVFLIGCKVEAPDVAAIKDMDIDYVIPLHCTGEPFYETAKAEMPNKLIRSYTGTRFVFNA